MRSAARAGGISDCEMRIDACVWCGVGDVGARSSAWEMSLVQWDSACGSRLFFGCGRERERRES